MGTDDPRPATHLQLLWRVTDPWSLLYYDLCSYGCLKFPIIKNTLKNQSLCSEIEVFKGNNYPESIWGGPGM